MATTTRSAPARAERREGLHKPNRTRPRCTQRRPNVHFRLSDRRTPDWVQNSGLLRDGQVAALCACGALGRGEPDELERWFHYHRQGLAVPTIRHIWIAWATYLIRVLLLGTHHDAHRSISRTASEGVVLVHAHARLREPLELRRPDLARSARAAVNAGGHVRRTCALGIDYARAVAVAPKEHSFVNGDGELIEIIRTRRNGRPGWVRVDGKGPSGSLGRRFGTFYPTISGASGLSRFWVGGTGTWDASTTTHWSATSGGAGGASAPDAGDNVFINASSGGGTITISGALCRSLDCTNAPATTLSWSSTTLSVGDGSGGAFKLVANITISNTGGTINFLSTSNNGGTGWAITTANKALPITHWNGVGGKWVLQDTSNFNGSFFLDNGTFDFNGKTVTMNVLNSNNANTRTLTFGAAAITLTSSGTPIGIQDDTNLTVTANTATLTCSGGGPSININGHDMNGASLTFTGGGTNANLGAGTWKTVTWTGTAGKTNNLKLTGNLTCTTSFVVNGNSAVNRVLVSSDTRGTARTITSALNTITNSDFMDITGAGAGSWNLAAITGLSGDCGGNSGITFTTPATQTHITAAGGNWSTAANWTSRVPLPQDNVVVNNNTTGTLTMDMPRLGKDLTFTGFAGSATLSVNTESYGSITIASGLTWTGSFGWTFAGRGSHTITSNGKTFNSDVTLEAVGGTYTLSDAFGTTTANNAVLVIHFGDFESGNQTLTIGGLASNTAQTTRTINLGTSTVNLTRSDTDGNLMNLRNVGTITWQGDSATYVISTTATVNRKFTGGGFTFGTLTYTVAGSTGSLTVVNSNTFGTFNFSDVTNARTLTFTAGTTTTITSAFNVDGTSGKLMTINSDTAGTAATLSMSSGLVIRHYLSIQDSTATGGATWYALNSTNVSGNTGWIFNAVAPTFVAGVGTVQTDHVFVAAPLPGVIAGVGAVQAPTEPDVGLPATVGGTGTVQAVALAAPPPVIAGTGTVQTPTVVTDVSATATPSVVAGTGTVQAPLELDAALPAVVSGIGTVQSPAGIETVVFTTTGGFGSYAPQTILGFGSFGSDGYLQPGGSFPNAGGASTPDDAFISAACSISLDLRVRCVLNDLQSSTTQYLVAKYDNALGKLSFYFSVFQGRLGFTLSFTGSGGSGVLAQTKIPVAKGQPVWLRMTWNSGGGTWKLQYASGNILEPATTDFIDITNSTIDGAFGSGQTIFDSAGALAIGDDGGDGSNKMNGKILTFEMWDASTLVSKVDYSQLNPSTSPVADTGTNNNGRVWTKRSGASQVAADRGIVVVTPLPSVVNGTGTVQTPLELAAATPGVIAGTGTVEAPTILSGDTATSPGVVGGTGTVEAPLIALAALPDVIAGTGTVEAPSTAAVVDVIAGVGTVQSTVLLAALPGLVAGVGTVESPTGIAEFVAAVIAGVGTVESVTGLDVALPGLVTGLGVVQSPELASLVAAVLGTGVVEAPMEALVGLPAVVVGTGTVFDGRGALVALAGLVAGTGTVLTPVITLAATPGVIAGIGTVEAPVEGAQPDVVTGTGTVESGVVALAALPALVTGAGIVQAPLQLELALPDVVAGVGTVESAVITLTALIGVIAGTGTVEAPAISADHPVLPDVVVGTGTVEPAVLLVAAFPAVITGTGQVEQPAPKGRIIEAFIAGVGVVQAPVIVELARPAVVLGIGAVESPTARVPGAPGAIAGVGTVELVAMVSLTAHPTFVAGTGTVFMATRLEAVITASVTGIGTVPFTLVALAATPSYIAGVGSVSGSPELGPATVHVECILGIGTVQTTLVGLLWVGVTLLLAITKREQKLGLTERPLVVDVQQISTTITSQERTTSITPRERVATVEVGEALEIRRS